MTTQITSQFQGVLQVPLFKTPYTIAQTKTGASPMITPSDGIITLNSAINTLGGGYPSGVLNATVKRLDIEVANTLNIGGGYDPTTGTLNGSSYLYWLFNFVALIMNPTLTSFNTVVFTGDVDVSGSLGVAADCVIPNIAAPIIQARGPFSAIGFLPSLLDQCVTSFYLSGTGNPAWIICWSVPSTHSALTFNGQAACPVYMEGTQGLFRYNNISSIPRGGTASTKNENCAFSQSTTDPGIWGLRYYIDLGVGAFIDITGELQLLFDNAVLNNAVNNLSAVFYGVATGWMLIVQGVGDFYISSDGSKYWQLNYVAGSGGVTGLPSAGTIEGSDENSIRTAVRNVDAAGTFWYTGQNTTSGGNTQPLYSLGFNVPFQLPTLAGVPPLKVPCWSPCYNMDIGIDKFPT